MTDVRWPDPKRCRKQVYVRDTYRYTGRGKSGFEMHYKRQQCARKVKDGDTYCWQHRKAGRDGEF